MPLRAMGELINFAEDYMHPYIGRTMSTTPVSQSREPETQKSYRNICFTLFYEDLTEVSKMEAWLEKQSYGVMGLETCPTTKKLHIQGYVEFKSPKTFKTLKRRWPSMHFEARHASAKAAAEYCKKEGQFKEFGQISCQGKRTDLIAAVELIQSGASIETVALTEPVSYVKYHSGLEKLAYHHSKHRSTMPSITWYWGEAGVGKSHKASENLPPEKVHRQHDPKWWDGYDQQECVILDDFDPESWNFRELLQCLDKYPKSVHTKGSFRKLNSPIINITCDRKPEDIWSGNLLKQITRRCKAIVKVEQWNGASPSDVTSPTTEVA